MAKFARSPIPWLTLSLAFALGFGLRLVGLKRTAVSGGTAHLLHAAKRVLPLWFDHFFSLLRPHAMMPPSLYEKYLLVPGWKVLLSAVVIGAFVYWLWRRRERDPIGLWAFATCLGLWAPVSLLTYQEGWFGWGRYLYASLGLLVIWLAFVLSQSARFSELISLRAVKATVALVVVIMGLQTYLAGHDWKNDRTFAEGILVDHPEQSVGYSELAVVELHDEKPAQAIALLERAISIQPKNHFHWSRASDALMKLGRRDAAFVAADKALRLDPKDVGARYITAIALLGRRQEAPAAQLLLGAISDDPDQEGPWVTLKQVLTHLGPDSVFSAEVRRTISEPAFASIRGRVVALLASVFSPAQGS